MTRNIRSHADLELSTALTHAPRSLVRGQELQHPAGPRARAIATVRMRVRIWKRTFRSAFSAKAGIQFS